MNNETTQPFDVIILGSGAGGAAAAYSLVNKGQKVLMLEKGDYLPTDGSTLDVGKVFKEGKFKNQRSWVNGKNETFIPGEFYNVGGKTKWYGAALLRFSPHEFEADAEFSCRGWPLSYQEIEPYYDRAEEMLDVNIFENEPELAAFAKRVSSDGTGWQDEALPLGLKKEILNSDNENEAKHFDGFASVKGLKADAEWNFLNKLKDHDNFTLLPNHEVVEILSTVPGSYESVSGVRCSNGSTFHAAKIILAAGAMTSPRILQDFLSSNDDTPYPNKELVGANFKMHLNSALLAFSPFTQHDVLRKTAMFLNEKFPHTTVQCLGWLDGEIISTQLPAAVPKFVAEAAGKRAFGFFVTTEDGSHVDNRILSCRQSGTPMMDYDLDRIPNSQKEHKKAIDSFNLCLLTAGMAGVSKYMGLAGTAHALGSLVTGDDPTDSVVDVHGKVHGIDNLYVSDGSVLPRASRVNPALTIYAWGLRLGDYLVDLAKTAHEK